VAKARAAASAIMTEEESCIEALTKREKGGVMSVLTIKFPVQPVWELHQEYLEL
jgi:hypothetical protein